MQEDKKQNKVDVIVVGAGPAGVSAAVTVARGGKKVVLVERGTFAGSKNMYGGVIYSHAAKEIFPDFEQSAPIERFVERHSYVLLSDEDDCTEICYRNPSHGKNSFVTARGDWDRWCVEQAMKEGVYFAPQTLIKNLIVENGKVVGITTDVEDYYADIVIIADGVNSLLAKQLGLRERIKPGNVVLGVKEVIKLSEETIEKRFALYPNTGAAIELVGGPFAGMFGLGFIYTNKNSVAVGLGVSLEDLKNKKLKPYELLDTLKSHPYVSRLIEGGELLEYSAHLIPEGGYKSMPVLYTDGAMVAGDAAMLVNNVHFEGTNFAMISGKYAGETALEAFEKNDFSANHLCLYKKKLLNSFILKDLIAYKDVVPTLTGRSSSFLGYYPEKVNEFFRIFTTTDGQPKKEKFQKFAKNFFAKRSLSELFSDAVAGIKLIFGILK